MTEIAPCSKCVKGHLRNRADSNAIVCMFSLYFDPNYQILSLFKSHTDGGRSLCEAL